MVSCIMCTFKAQVQNTQFGATYLKSELHPNYTVYKPIYYSLLLLVYPRWADLVSLACPLSTFNFFGI